jgi:REP element-mobilizing transposase RayT
MANTYTCIYLHVVFSTKNRERWITPDIEEKVWSYLGGICRAHNLKALQIGGVEDHVHLLVSLIPTTSISEFIRRLKGESSKWISSQWPKMKGFAWQDGYGAFSIGQSHVSDTLSYITQQRAHHTKVSFESEYRKFLKRHALPVDERYLLG